MTELPSGAAAASGVVCLSDLLISAVQRHGDKLAVIETDGNAKATYAELDRASTALAAYLAGLNVGRGDAVALHLQNSLDYIVADLAILKLCAVKVPLNELMAPDEIAYCLDHAQARVLIRHAHLPLPSAFPEQLSTVLVVGAQSASSAWQDALKSDPRSFRRSAPQPDDIAVVAYTGGTTGKPKGVTHVQSGLGLNLLAHVVCGDVRSDEVMALTTPLPHSAGYHLHACLLQGGRAVLARKFDPEVFVRIARDHDATWTFAVPTMIYRLLDHLQGAPGALSSLRTIVYGAAPMSVERLAQGLVAFGPVFIQIYGQTECPNFITTLSKLDHLDPSLLASCGRPVPFLQVDVVAPGGAPAAIGEVGEIVVRSPYNLIGYFRNPSATGETLRDGALHTGDLALRDSNGFIFLVDRAKDMIITGGMNVYSVEVERALRSHAAVGDAAVIGLPDADWGERVVAVVTERSPVDAGELREALRKQISAYKVPKEIVSIPAMPLTPYGKIDKKQLRATLSARGST